MATKEELEQDRSDLAVEVGLIKSRLGKNVSKYDFYSLFKNNMALGHSASESRQMAFEELNILRNREQLEENLKALKKAEKE